MLKQGIYEHIINKETERNIEYAEQLGLVCQYQPIDAAESPQMLANYLANAIRKKLEDTEEQQDRVNIINRIMIDAGLIDDKQISQPTNLLSEVMKKPHLVKKVKPLPCDPYQALELVIFLQEEIVRSL